MTMYRQFVPPTLISVELGNVVTDLQPIGTGVEDTGEIIDSHVRGDANPRK